MERYSITIPIHYNSGAPVPRPIFQEIEQELDQVVGGWTRLDGYGGWSGSDSYYREPIALYFVDTADPTASEALLALARRTAEALRQEAVYVTRQEIETYLVAPAAV